MGESKLSALVARLKDDLNEREEQLDLANVTDFANSPSPNQILGPTSREPGPTSSAPGPTLRDSGPTYDIGSSNPPGGDDQQPLLLEEGDREAEENGGSLNGSRRLGDVALRIPLRLQKMRAASAKNRVVHRPYFTIFISIVDVIFLIVEIVVNKGFTSFKENPWIGPSAETLIELGGKFTPYIIELHQWWRLITPVFLHVGIGHLLLNLLAQLPLGIQLERVLGTPRIIILYFVSAIAGNLASAIFLPLQIEVGASTAIYGLASYYLVDLLIHWTLVFAPMRYFAALTAGSLVGLFIGLLPGIDNFAHLGGSAGGFLVSLLLVPRTREGRSMKYAKVASWVGPPLLVVYFAGGIAVLCVNALREDVWRCVWCEYLNCLPIAHWCVNQDPG